MARQSDHSDDLETPNDFEAVLKAVARPPEVGRSVLAHVALPSTLDMPESQLPFAQPTAPEPAAGDLLDERYRLDRILGRGGMGVVYAARNLRTGKMVAIKWMSVGRRHSAAATTTMAERFRREARAAASIRHPNVVDVYDVGGPDDAPFLVMELLEGEALSARIRQGTLPFDEAARVMRGVMRGVSAAHRGGIVHRDLKPDNVFLCAQPDGGASLPKVLDFGVAAIRGDSAEGLASLTRTGAIIGTPAYMSPEQLTGRSVDARTDVYALGVMLFEALTAKLPFDAKNASELAVMQATSAPTRVSKLRPELFGACERLMTRALAREASDRYASVDEFAQALDEVRTGPTKAVDGEKNPRRLVRGLLALAVVLLLVGL